MWISQFVEVVIKENRPWKQAVRAYVIIRVARFSLFSGGAAKIASELRKRVRNVRHRLSLVLVAAQRRALL